MFCNVIYCYMVNYLKSKWYKTTITVYFLFYNLSGGQEFGNGLAGWIWLRVCLEVSVKIFAGAE